MTKQEFEQLTGKKIEDELFSQVHTAYMAAGDEVSKEKFCSMWKNAEGLKELVFRLTTKIESLSAMADQRDIMSYVLIDAAEDIRRGRSKADYLDETALNNIGYRAYLMHKLKNGYSLTDKDKEAILMRL